MGRLMDSIMAAVGLKPSDRVVISYAPSEDRTSQPKQIPPEEASSVDKSIVKKNEKDKKTDQIKSKDAVELPYGQIKPKEALELLPGLSSLPPPKRLTNKEQEEVIKAEKEKRGSLTGLFNIDITPGEDGQVKDCMGCKITGTVIGPVVSLYIIRVLYKKHHLYTGATKVAYIAQGTILASALTTMSICRYFDIGPFDPKKVEWSLTDHYRDEIRQLGIFPDKSAEDK